MQDAKPFLVCWDLDVLSGDVLLVVGSFGFFSVENPFGFLFRGVMEIYVVAEN